MEEIADRVFLVHGGRGGRFPRSHAVLVLDRVRVLIDAGCGRDVLARVRERHAPDKVVLSHAHPDHCSGASGFPPFRVWTPREHRETTGRLERMAERFIAPPLRETWMAYMREEVGFRSFTAGHVYGSGDVFDLGDLHLVPVHAPWHTDDHYCFHIPEASVMVTTDIDFTRFGPWYANDESDIDTFLESIDRVRAYDAETVVSSHEGVIRKGIQRRFDRFAAAFEEREERLLKGLERPATLEEIVDRAIIYGSFPIRPRILRFWEHQMIGKHLARLEARERVRRLPQGAFVRIS